MCIICEDHVSVYSYNVYEGQLIYLWMKIYLTLMDLWKSYEKYSRPMTFCQTRLEYYNNTVVWR